MRSAQRRLVGRRSGVSGRCVPARRCAGPQHSLRQPARAAQATSPRAQPARQARVKRRGGARRRLVALALAYGQRAVRMGYDRALFGMRLAACRTLSQARPRGVRRRALAAGCPGAARHARARCSAGRLAAKASRPVSPVRHMWSAGAGDRAVPGAAGPQRQPARGRQGAPAGRRAGARARHPPLPRAQSGAPRLGGALHSVPLRSAICVKLPSRVARRPPPCSTLCAHIIARRRYGLFRAAVRRRLATGEQRHWRAPPSRAPGRSAAVLRAEALAPCPRLPCCQRSCQATTLTLSLFQG